MYTVCMRLVVCAWAVINPFFEVYDKHKLDIIQLLKSSITKAMYTNVSLLYNVSLKLPVWAKIQKNGFLGAY